MGAVEKRLQVNDETHKGIKWGAVHVGPNPTAAASVGMGRSLAPGWQHAAPWMYTAAALQPTAARGRQQLARSGKEGRLGRQHAVRPAEGQLACQRGQLLHARLHHPRQVHIALQAGGRARAGETAGEAIGGSPGQGGRQRMGSDSTTWRHSTSQGECQGSSGYSISGQFSTPRCCIRTPLAPSSSRHRHRRAQPPAGPPTTYLPNSTLPPTRVAAVCLPGSAHACRRLRAHLHQAQQPAQLLHMQAVVLCECPQQLAPQLVIQQYHLGAGRGWGGVGYRCGYTGMVGPPDRDGADRERGRMPGWPRAGLPCPVRSQQPCPAGYT